MRTLPMLARTLVLTTAVVGTLTPVGLATAEAAAPPAPKTGHHAAAGGPVSRAEAFFTCEQAQQRSNRVQRIRQSAGKELAYLQASESQATKDNKPALVASWKSRITKQQRYETYLIRYWHSAYAKQKTYASYVLHLNKKGARATRGEARLKACKVKKLTFPASKTPKAPKAPSTKKPQAKAPSTTKPPASTTPSTTTPSTTTPSTTTPPVSTTPSTTGSGSSTTTTPAGTTPTSSAPGGSTTPSSTTTTTSAGGTATLPGSTTSSASSSTPGA